MATITLNPVNFKCVLDSPNVDLTVTLCDEVDLLDKITILRNPMVFDDGFPNLIHRYITGFCGFQAITDEIYSCTLHISKLDSQF